MSSRLISYFSLWPLVFSLWFLPLSAQPKAERIRLDFNTSREEVINYLKLYYPGLSDSMMRRWERTGALEMRVINGQKRYFSQAARNLFRIDPEARAVWRTFYPPKLSASARFNMAHAREVIDLTRHADPVLDQVFTIHFTLTVKPDVVPDGEMIRCWMPFPRVSLPRQSRVELLEVNAPSYTLAPPGALQRSLYIEKPAVKGKPAVFSYRARFHSAAQWFDPRRLHAEPYDTTTELYHKFTAERPPQVIFSPLVRETADRIVGGETDPFKIVKKLYYWINENIPWASALEYSIMDCIPDYVLTYRHGDCGMQTFLFISMCRYKGIPARWQSGWHVHPGNKNLHDWSEVYFQGTGWVPVDVSFGLQDSDDPLVRDFYLTGMDAYRMIVNDDFSIPFTPAKKYERSEPYDFQRGEVEWRGGNLYFNQWTYQMDVTSRTGDLSRALVDVSVCNLRTRPGHSQELSSQALMGTPLRVLKKQGSWYRVQTPEQYVTWVDAPAITLLSEQEMEAWKKSRRVVFTGEFGEVKNPEPPYNVVSDLTMGCILQVVRESGQSLLVRLPDGRSGMIPQKNTVPVKVFAAQRYPDFAPIISMAETFMGRPYLWGGTSARGIDCSGFMKTLFLMHGVILSRDAWQQAKHGKEVVFSGDDRVLQPGDLLFFGRRATDTKPEKVTHVALYIGDGKFIHSSGRVKINSLRSTDPDYSSYLKSILLHVRRIHQLDTPNGPWSMQHHKWYF